MYRYQVWGHHEALLAWNARASSKMRTAVVVVVFVGSRVGATSTRSIPTSPREEIRRTIRESVSSDMYQKGGAVLLSGTDTLRPRVAYARWTRAPERPRRLVSRAARLHAQRAQLLYEMLIGS